ncbi:CheR family methyltransferase [Rhodospira trueperi]|uniref:Chemotaxis protein methyltransferase n=1 Tax=Rhodospira trueperi TaxID=69960 RepID=A0A1G7HB12_9PROT|nr:protein-glutamate O-methyltransferase CheR [Rhodospira trueperi]SDE97484.1 chemotaxis protein methyltransferase CheR [Rhodospira trueperi]
MDHDARPTADIHLSDVDFERFQEFFYRKTGIQFGENKRYFVDRRVAQRMHETGSTTFRSYLTFVKFEVGQHEFQRLVDIMTVNETYFYREAFQFDCMVQDVLGECLVNRRGHGPLRIWSMPCSTGEEIYSIALYLLERWPKLREIDVELVGADINETALLQARRGLYGPRAVQNLPASILNRYFTPKDGETLEIKQDIRDAVDFVLCNICDKFIPPTLSNFDIVFCRNMLIYFDTLSQKRAVENIFSALRPGGFLFLGHSESMSRVSSVFTVRTFADSLAYQRPLS